MTQSGHWKETEKPEFTETPEEPPCLCYNLKAEIHGNVCESAASGHQNFKAGAQKEVREAVKSGLLDLPRILASLSLYLPNLYMAEVGHIGENKEHEVPNNV